jgi:hypothetical protein
MRYNRVRFVKALAIAVGSAIALAATPALAAPAGLSLTVSPLVVEFHAGAGDTATAKVTVRNGGSDPERIIALRMDWRVAADGTVRVEQPGTEGAASISDYLRMEPADLPLAPGETRELNLTLDLPASFSKTTGVYHSGFLLRAVPLTGHVNFGPGATVVAYDTVGTPVSHAKITQLHVSTQGNGSALLSARIANDGSAYARPTGRIVLRRDGHVVVDQTDSIPVLFANEARVYNKALNGLAPGAYDVSFTVDYGGPTLIEGSTEVHVR